jgi:hypothetical protein
MAVTGAFPVRAQTDPSGHWRTWHTAHFRIHARIENEQAALHAAVEAEQAYRWLSAELQPPRGTIDLVLYDNADVSNGATAVFPTSRIFIYLTPPAGDPQLAPYDDWLRLVITHELTHAFHLDRVRGIWRLGQDVFGRAPGLFPNSYQPSWVKEGLAEYYESRLTTGGRLRGGMQEQLLAAAAPGPWPGPGDATLLSPKWPSGYLPYAWGAGFFEIEQQARGDSVAPRFVRRSAGQLWPFATSRVLKQVGGLGVDTAWLAMHAHWDSVASEGAVGAVVVRGLRLAPRPRLSPDGTRLAYVEATGRSNARVVLRDVVSGHVLAFHQVNSEVDLAWLGDTVYVSQLEFTSPVTLREGLYRWVPGRSWGRVPGSMRLARPFVGPRARLSAVDVGVASRRAVQFAEGRWTPLPLPPADAWSYLGLSPDGQWMAGARHAGGQWDIAVWPAVQPDQAIVVTSDASLDDDPVWAPAGDELLFTSERSGLPQILSYSVPDRSLRQLSNAAAGARQPAVTRNGSLYYATFLWDGWAIVRARPLALDPGPPPPKPVLGRDTIATTAVRETGYEPWPSLLPRYWLPTWHDVGTAGRFVGIETSGIDAVGRTSYLLQLAATPDKGRVEANFQAVHQRWRSVVLDAGYTVAWDSLLSRFGLLQTDSTPDTVRVTYGDLQQTATAGATLEWRRWRTLLELRVGGELEAERLVIDTVERGPSGIRLSKDHFTFSGPVVSFAARHLSYPALAISPEDGLAVAGLYRYRRELGTGSGWWSEVRGAASVYVGLELPGFAHWVLAARAAAGARNGPSADYYDLGGASGDPYQVVTGYAIGPGRRAFPLRGYPAVGTRFTRAAVGALELRVPVALVARGIGKLPLGLDRVSVSGFAEAGGGWGPGESSDVFALRDAGGEVVLDAGVPQDVPIRARVGAGIPLVSGLGVAAGRARWYLAFGTSF